MDSPVMINAMLETVGDYVFPVCVDRGKSTGSAIGMAECLKRIEEFREYNAFLSLSDETGDGDVVGVKDNIDVMGQITTCGSASNARAPAVRDAAVVERLRLSKCVVVGKTNLSPWAADPTGLNSVHGDPLNPRDRGRIPGGSSSGSAIAVALGMCDWAIGTDTGGSIRTPAGLCGVVGFKPTLGRISTRGVFPVSQSLDTIGILARDVETASRASAVLGIDGSCVGRQGSMQDVRIATPRRWIRGLDERTARLWAAISADVPSVDLPKLGLLQECHRAIVRTELAANHYAWRRDGNSGYDAASDGQILEGEKISGVQYLTALSARTCYAEQVDRAFSGLDAIVLPTTACVAPEISRARQRSAIWDALACFTRPFNVTGHPVVSLPVLAGDLPIGIQVVGRRGADIDLLRTCRFLETRFRDIKF